MKEKQIMTKFKNAAGVTAIVGLVLSLFAVAMPVSAYNNNRGGNETDNSVRIEVKNSAAVINSTTATADSGDNYAGGSKGGDGEEGGNGGNGGDAEDNEGGDNEAGNGGNGGIGGNGGNGGPGGLITTGNARAAAGSFNMVNTTDVEVEGCGCGDDEDDDYRWWMRGHRGGNDVDNSINVEVDNEALVLNSTEAHADSGDNVAKGSQGGDGEEGGNGGNGGDAEDNEGNDNRNKNRGWGWSWGHGFGNNNNGGDNEAGNGGNGGIGGHGGNGGVGGEVRSGAAEANSGTINVVNSTVVRTAR